VDFVIASMYVEITQSFECKIDNVYLRVSIMCDCMWVCWTRVCRFALLGPKNCVYQSFLWQSVREQMHCY